MPDEAPALEPCPSGKGHKFNLHAGAYMPALFLWCEHCGQLRNIVADESGQVARSD